MDNELEIKKITDELSFSLKELFGKDLKRIILYGSYARGDYDHESDIDVFILVDIDQRELAMYQKYLVEISTNISLKYDVLISLHEQDLSTFEKWRDVLPFYQNVINEGVVISG